jgi:hypothetical protein
MQNPVLERQLTDCKELAESWRRFLDLFNLAIRGGDKMTPQAEQTFLEAKSRIAMLHDTFMEALRHDQQIGQNIFSIIARCITMRHINKMSPAETKKIEIEWHESFLLLNETISTLDEEIQRLASINPTKYHLKRFAEGLKANLIAFLKSRLLKFAIGVAAVFFVIWGIPMFGIYEYDNLRKVNGVNKVYFGWLNAKRGILDKTAPYGRIDDFTNLFLPHNTTPLGSTIEVCTTGQDSAISKVIGYGARNTKSGKTVREILEASTYKAALLQKIESKSRRTEVWMFHVYHNRDAQEVAQTLKDTLSKSTYTTFAINNVYVVLNGSDDAMRKEIATVIFKQPAY